jgi:hypothetical protein
LAAYSAINGQRACDPNHWKRQRQQAAQGDDAFTYLEAPLRNLRRPTGLAGLRRLLAAALRR